MRLVTQSCLTATPWTVAYQAPLSMGIIQARILEWVSMPLLQEIFQTQGSSPGLLHFRQILYYLSHQRSPWILEWAAYPFSRGSSQPRNRTGVSLIAGGFFTSWATREAQEYWSGQPIPSPGDLSDPGIELGSPTLQVHSLPTEPPAKPKNTGVGSLSLLQGIFPTQESNQGLLHCRWINMIKCSETKLLRYLHTNWGNCYEKQPQFNLL